MSTKHWYKILLEDKVLMGSHRPLSFLSEQKLSVHALIGNSQGVFPGPEVLGVSSPASFSGFSIASCLHMVGYPAWVEQKTCAYVSTATKKLKILCLHAFFPCQLTSVAGLLGYVQTLAPTLSPKAALRQL